MTINDERRLAGLPDYNEDRYITRDEQIRVAAVTTAAGLSERYENVNAIILVANALEGYIKLGIEVLRPPEDVA